VFNIDYKICSRKTNKQQEVKIARSVVKKAFFAIKLKVPHAPRTCRAHNEVSYKCKRIEQAHLTERVNI
jgi:hypothetical protein